MKEYVHHLKHASPIRTLIIIKLNEGKGSRPTWRSCRSWCAGIEQWIGSASIHLPIGEPSSRPSSQSALLLARSLCGLSHYYTGFSHALKARLSKRTARLPLCQRTSNVSGAQQKST